MLYFQKKNPRKVYQKDKSYPKVRDYCHYTGIYRGAVHSICNLKLNVPNQIPVVFHNVSNYDQDFIIKELANESEGQFESLGKTKKVHKFFCSKKLIIMVMKVF